MTSLVLDVYVIGIIATAFIAALGSVVVVLNASIEGWRQSDYRILLGCLSGLGTAPAWPLTFIVGIALLYRRAFPAPTAADLADLIRKAEREAGIA